MPNLRLYPHKVKHWLLLLQSKSCGVQLSNQHIWYALHVSFRKPSTLIAGPQAPFMRQASPGGSPKRPLPREHCCCWVYAEICPYLHGICIAVTRPLLLTVHHLVTAAT